MTSSDVLAYLKKNQDARGIAHWKERDRTLKSYGVGLTKLRTFAKQIGRDSALARKLWKSKVYEMRILSLLIDDPKVMTMAISSSCAVTAMCRRSSLRRFASGSASRIRRSRGLDRDTMSALVSLLLSRSRFTSTLSAPTPASRPSSAA